MSTRVHALKVTMLADAPRSPLATVTSLTPRTARHLEPVEEGPGG